MHNHDKNRELNSWFDLHVKIPGLPSVGMPQITLEEVNLALQTQNLKCGTLKLENGILTLSCILLLYPFL